MSESITMMQMAKELKVSQVTVSAVVNGREKKQRVSEQTAKRIREYLDQRGYVQSKSALQVKNGTSQDTVGILYCGKFMHFSHLITALSNLSEAIEEKHGMVDITGVLPNKITDGLREQVGKRVKRLIWIHANHPKEEIENAEKLFPLLSHMEQVIIYNYSNLNDEWEKEYLKHGIQLVGFNRSKTYHKVAEIFKNSGHNKIALDEIAFDDSQPELDKMTRINSVFKDCGFNVYGLRPEGVYEMSNDKLAEALAKNLLYQHKYHQVNCAFIRNDLMGTAVINILLQKGIKVPEDISIIGFGDLPLARFQPIPLTTFRHPIEEMCAKTLELLGKKSSGTGKKYDFEDTLILRESHISEISK